MFCKKCGSKISDNAKFCPKCGAVSGAGGANTDTGIYGRAPGSQGAEHTQQMMPGMDIGAWQYNRQTRPEKKGMDGKTKKILLISVIAILAAAAVAGMAVLTVSAVRKSHKSKDEDEKASIVGEWKSEDAVNGERILYEMLADVLGLPDDIAEGLIEYLGLDDILGSMTVTFTPSGSIYLGIDSFSIGTLFSLEYEEMGDDRVIITVRTDGFSLFGTSIPSLSANYTADYTVTEDTLKIDFFGETIKFERQ